MRRVLLIASLLAIVAVLSISFRFRSTDEARGIGFSEKMRTS